MKMLEISDIVRFFWEWAYWFFVAYIVVRIYKACVVLFNSVLAHFVYPIYNLDHLKDTWTVCTGATDGIGRAYVAELARARGIRKFYLIGRNPKKLEDVKQELVDGFGAEVKTAVFDFAKDEFDKIPEELKNLDVGILINCAGIAPTAVGNLVEQERGLGSQILRVNLVSPVKMLEIIVPGMIRRDRGVVINVSSMTCWRPMPYLSTYPASKAALAFYANALNDEFKNTNVKFQCLVPLLVATKAASYETSEANNLFVVTTENFARQAVRLIGRWELATGCIQHDIQVAIGALVSFSLLKFFYVPLIMLGVHKERVASYQKKHQHVE